MIFVLTSDVDFVSDDFLELAYNPLKDYPLTVFMTEKSDFLENALQQNSSWEPVRKKNNFHSISNFLRATDMPSSPTVVVVMVAIAPTSSGAPPIATDTPAILSISMSLYPSPKATI